MKKDYNSALDREKNLEREQEQALKQLNSLRKTRERNLGDIRESNIDPASS